MYFHVGAKRETKKDVKRREISVVANATGIRKLTIYKGKGHSEKQNILTKIFLKYFKIIVKHFFRCTVKLRMNIRSKTFRFLRTKKS